MEILTPVSRKQCGTTNGYRLHKNNKESVCSLCSGAHRIYSANYYVANRGRILAKQEIDRKSHPEKFKIKAKIYRISNPEKIKERSRRNYLRYIDRVRVNRQVDRLSNPEKFKVRDRENRLKYPEKMITNGNKRRARKRNAVSEPYTVQQILDLYGTDCHICKEPIDLDAPRSVHKEGYQRGLHLDHVIPLSKGGSDLIENVKPSHAQCNLRKNARLVA